MTHDQKSCKNVQVDLVRRTGLKKEETALTSDKHLIVLNLQGNSERGEYFLDGRRTSFVKRTPGAVLFVPAGCKWSGWEEGASTAAYISISISRDFVKTFSDSVDARFRPDLSPDLGFEDPIIMHAARSIGAEIHEESPLSYLLVESYAATIFAQLFRRVNYLPSRASSGGLSPKVTNRVMEKINADLASDLPLSDLAAIAGISIPHFCRAFKKSIGKPPHAYIHKRRLERVQEYLRQNETPITEIALMCGFSSSSHLATAFRREFGMTPVSYRLLWSEKPSH